MSEALNWIRRNGDRGAEVLAAVVGLESRHRSAERVHAEFDAHIVGIAPGRSAGKLHVGRFPWMVAAATSLYCPYIIGNEVVFPVTASSIVKGPLAGVSERPRLRPQPDPALHGRGERGVDLGPCLLHVGREGVA